MPLFHRSPDHSAAPGRAEALACIPQIVPTVSSRETASGDILIEYPLTLKPLLQAIFNRFNGGKTEQLTRKLQLDNLGSKVWRLIDGKSSVSRIISSFAASSTFSLQEAEQSVTAFLRELGRRGIIVLRESGAPPSPIDKEPREL